MYVNWSLPDEGIIVLGVRRRDGGFLGAPTGDVQLQPGDTAVVYGREEAVAQLAERLAGTAGDRAHPRPAPTSGKWSSVSANATWASAATEGTGRGDTSGPS